MQLSRYIGWETLLVFSVYGGFLRILPFPKIFAWGISILAFSTSIMVSLGYLSIKSIRLDENKLIALALFLLIFVWAILSIVWSPISLSRLIVNDVFIVIVVLIPTVTLLICCESGPDAARRCMTGLVCALFPVSIYILILWINSDQDLYKMLLQMSLDNGVVGNIYLGVGIIYTLSSITCILWSINGDSHRKSAFIAGIIALYLSMQSGGRGPLISGLCSLFILAFFSLAHRRCLFKRQLESIFLVLLISVILALLFNYVFSAVNIDDKLAIAQRFSADKARDYDEFSSIGFRLAQYKEVISLISERPIIGNGVLSYRVLTNFHDNIYPHNIVLDVWGDLGLIGLILLLSLIFMGVRCCWIIVGKNDSVYSLLCAGVFLFFLFESQFSGYVYWSQLWLWLSIVVVCSGKYTEESRGQH